jgi:hypothetical protein
MKYRQCCERCQTPTQPKMGAVANGKTMGVTDTFFTNVNRRLITTLFLFRGKRVDLSMLRNVNSRFRKAKDLRQHQHLSLFFVTQLYLNSV